MKMSEQINELAAALAKAQGQIKAALEDHTAKVASEKANYSYGYATLASVWDACRKPLADNGLSVSQSPETENMEVTVTTLLMHASGQWIESVLTFRAEAAAPQKIGSAITYARRYALSAMVGVAPSDDDDGAAASGVPTTFEPRGKQTKTPPTNSQKKTQAPAETAQATAVETPQQVLSAALRGVGCTTPDQASKLVAFVTGGDFTSLPKEMTPEVAERVLVKLQDALSDHSGPELLNLAEVCAERT